METRRTQTREEEAQRELGTTNIGVRAARAFAAFFVVVLALPTLLLPFSRRALPQPTAAVGTTDDRVAILGVGTRTKELLSRGKYVAAILEFVRGTVEEDKLREFEGRWLDKTVIGRSWRPFMHAVLFRELGRGSDNVLVGRAGALLWQRDVAPLWERAPAHHIVGPARRGVAAAVAATVDFAAQLEQRGVLLVVVPVPPSASIYPDRVTASTVTVPMVSSAYRTYLDSLTERRVRTVDLAAVFSRVAMRRDLYLRRNTHWSPLGALVAARGIADEVRRSSWRSRAPSATECIIRDVPQDVGSDLMQIMHLPPDTPGYFEPTILYEPLREGQPLMPQRTSEVLVLGDSFLRIFSGAVSQQSGGLIEHLACQLHTTTDRIFVRGGGATRVREALASRSARLDSKTLVVWEFAARELSDSDWVPVSLDQLAGQ